MEVQLFNYLKDRKQIIEDSKLPQIKERIKFADSVVCDFTEYNPLHKGHKYALESGKKYGFFIAVLPGPLERSGRGKPYIFDRYIRAKMAVANGADLVVEGPPMGILSSGQYIRCLVKMFYYLCADYICRGYIPSIEMGKIINLISNGKHMKIRTGEVSCFETGEKICEKLEIDNYVIASMSQTIYKLFKDSNWKPKFVFVPRLEGISGTKIREYIFKGDMEKAKEMLPKETIEIIKNDKPEILHYFKDRILETANEYDLYKYFPDKIAEYIEKNRPYESIEDIKVPKNTTKNFYYRVLCKLEARIEKEIIQKYVDNYPQKIKILANKYNYVL